MTDLSALTLLAAAVFGYALGSIPFGVLFTRAAGLGDIRSIGSGNIGATNVLRTGHKGLAAATLLADALKGTAAVVIAAQYGETGGLAAGISAFLGHLFPVWLNFKGGKGVATYIGVLLGISPAAFAVFAGTWLAVAAVTRYSSLSALVAASIAPVILFILGATAAALTVLAMSALVFARHRANIERLIKGEEPRIGQQKQA